MGTIDPLRMIQGDFGAWTPLADGLIERGEIVLNELSEQWLTVVCKKAVGGGVGLTNFT